MSEWNRFISFVVAFVILGFIGHCVWRVYLWDALVGSVCGVLWVALCFVAMIPILDDDFKG